MTKRSVFFLLLLLNSFLLIAQNDSTAYDYGKWGFGIELGPGTGAIMLTGEAAQNFESGLWSYSNLGLTVSRKKIQGTAHLGGISSSLRNDLAFGTGWQKNNFVWSSHVQFSLGYEALHKRYFNIIPFVRAGSLAFSTRVDTTGSKITHADPRLSCSAGIAFDLKLPLPLRKERREYPGAAYDENCFYLRLYAGLYPGYFQMLQIKGNMYYANLSLGWYIRPVREVRTSS